MTKEHQPLTQNNDIVILNDNNDEERNLSSSSSSSSSHPQFSAYTTLNNLKKQYSIEENAKFINFGKVKEKDWPAILLKEKEKNISDKSKLQKSFIELFMERAQEVDFIKINLPEFS
jgi:hypothetical protein